jgi:hypothetical protein
MRKLILCVIATTSLFASTSLAEFAVGGYFGMNQSQPSYSGTDSYSGKQGTELGALVLFPFFPTLNFRIGLAQKVRKTRFESTTVAGSTDVSETLTDLGLGIQWDLPVTDLYVMGGAKISSSQSISCDNTTPGLVVNCEKTKTDYPLFVGIGYNLFNFTVVHLAIEGEYARGSSSGFAGAKNNDLTGRLMLKVGL